MIIKKSIYICKKMRRELLNIGIYHSNFIERDRNEQDLYNTIEELKKAEGRGEGKVNWQVWKWIVDETKEQLKNIIFYDTKTIIQVFDLKGHLINEYDSYKEAARDWCTTPELVSVYCRSKQPYLKQKVYFRSKTIKIERQWQNKN